MIDEFILNALAQIDDLTELKVSLVALRLLEARLSETASITRDELAAHPALRTGLGFAPDIALDAALKRAVARGTLLATAAISARQERYFANTEAGRRAVEVVESAMQERGGAAAPAVDAVARTLAAVGREIERLEMIEAYPAADGDRALVVEWLAQGYAPAEILAGVRTALQVPRPARTAPRTLDACVAQVTYQPPAAPSAYYQAVIARVEPPGDEVVAFRELARRWPTGREFVIVRTAVGLFGARATIQVLKRLVRRDRNEIDALIPLLAEEEEAALAVTRRQAEPDPLSQEIVKLYESTFGLPPTSHVATDIVSLAVEVPDLEVWRGAFQYAAHQNKRDWGYVRRLLLNPSPSIYLPAPVNEAAQFAFNEYKRRVSRGQLDPSVAREINEVAASVSDPARWTQAIDKAANANALNWNYIKKVLTSPDGAPGERKGEGEVKDGKRRRTTGPTRRGSTFRTAQVNHSTEQEREAAREHARRRIEERTKRDTPQGNSNSGS